jgi:CheY-like chemotaxis protein
MPEVNGFEATAAIGKREVSTGKHVPIVASAAHAMMEDRERCLSAGMDGCVHHQADPPERIVRGD